MLVFAGAKTNKKYSTESGKCDAWDICMDDKMKKILSSQWSPEIHKFTPVYIQKAIIRFLFYFILILIFVFVN